MTIGVGGSNAKIELEKLVNMTSQVNSVSEAEFKQRITKAQALMAKHNIAATYIDAGTNLYYFTGTRWYASERMVGAIIPQKGEIQYIAPSFEVNTLNQYMTIKGEIKGWQEHENPYQLVAQTLKDLGITTGQLAIDESTAFFIADGINKATPELTLIDAKAITAGCRAEKSTNEIALLQQAKNMTLEVHKAVARILRIGITVEEVTNFIDQAHRKVGAKAGSYFCIVLFGDCLLYTSDAADE